MNKTPLTEITVRVPLNQLPTEKDHLSAQGIEFLEQRLFQAGWVEEAGMVLKRFKVSSKQFTDHGKNYIEWKAVLQD